MLLPVKKSTRSNMSKLRKNIYIYEERDTLWLTSKRKATHEGKVEAFLPSRIVSFFLTWMIWDINFSHHLFL